MVNSIKSIFRRRAYKWHRGLTAIAILQLTMCAASGLLHQAGAWFKPKYDKNLVVISPTLTQTGKLDLVITKRYKPGAKVRKLELITSFNHRYSEKHKVLPVYEATLQSENETRLYIDLTAGKIVTASNKASRGIHKWFGYLHKFSFLDFAPLLRISLVVFLSVITFLAGGSGVYLYWLLPTIKSKAKLDEKKLEKIWHRRIGICTSLFMILFAATGAMHALADLFPQLRTVEKPIFDQLHMYRFADVLGSSFRFWWLFLVAASLLVLVGSGFILLIRVVEKYVRRGYSNKSDQRPREVTQV